VGAAQAGYGSMVECLNCGKRRDLPDGECPRCSYLGWAFVERIDETLRKRLRARLLTDRRIRVAS
jgi:hypothetical protein